jgi:hypothetical protein
MVISTGLARLLSAGVRKGVFGRYIDLLGRFGGGDSVGPPGVFVF